MQRAGLAVARLALALAPHAQRIWLACGPGNNGGDGLEAALHLQRWGKQPIVTWLGDSTRAPADALAALQRATAAGVTIVEQPPAQAEFCVDALLGIGSQQREPAGRMADWIKQMNGCGAPILAVDLPTGLNADSGIASALHVKACHTLSLLTLKPGLFTAQGRDACGQLWLDDLGIGPDLQHSVPATARLVAQPELPLRAHASHKGSFGDVAVLGGAPGMTGAALLAATAALHAGAGRVLVGLLEDLSQSVDMTQPELMFRPIDSLDFTQLTLVCGCGAGTAVNSIIHRVLVSAAPLVLDADALNAIAADTSLQALLRERALRASSVLTPHPLEAARLLACSVGQVQQDRLAAAEQLAAKFACAVVLKGSGSVIAAPGQITVLNFTGNARLASAGTGDVLAGLIGARLASGAAAFEAACTAVYQHGHLADDWPAASALTASRLAQALSCGFR